MSYPKAFDKTKLIEFGAAYMFYIEKHKLMEIISRLLAEIASQPISDIRVWLGQNIRRVAIDIYTKTLDCLHRGVGGDFYQFPRSFFHRIVLHGRPGSGRHSLAHVLANRFNLLILDVDVLAYHYINGHQQDALAKRFQNALERDCVYARSEAIGQIIQQRLLKEDALHRGWILFNYPNNKCEANELFEGFTVPPNRLIFLQIDEHMARMRILTRPYASNPQTTVTYLDNQMQQFRKSEKKLNAYLSHRREVIYVDATSCFEEVKCQVLSELTKTPYVLGYKYGEPSAKD